MLLPLITSGEELEVFLQERFQVEMQTMKIRFGSGRERTARVSGYMTLACRAQR